MQRLRTKPQLNIELETELNEQLETACLVLFEETKVKVTKADFVRKAISERISNLSEAYPHIRNSQPEKMAA